MKGFSLHKEFPQLTNNSPIAALVKFLLPGILKAGLTAQTIQNPR